MLIDDVQQAMFQAMKACEPGRRPPCGWPCRRSSAAIDARGDLPDDEAVAVLQREARKRREAEQVYRDAGRAERADQEAYERSVLERFLPAALDPAELARLVDEAVAPRGPAGPRSSARSRAASCPRSRAAPTATRSAAWCWSASAASSAGSRPG